MEDVMLSAADDLESRMRQIRATYLYQGAGSILRLRLGSCWRPDLYDFSSTRYLVKDLDELGWRLCLARVTRWPRQVYHAENFVMVANTMPGHSPSLVLIAAQHAF
jgi:hypothetical protein